MHQLTERDSKWETKKDTAMERELGNRVEKRDVREGERERLVFDYCR